MPTSTTDHAGTPRNLPAPTTWSAYEITPGGRERPLADHLTYTQVLAAHFPDAVWNVVWRQDS